MIDMKNLHDATFSKLQFGWEGGDLYCDFAVSMGEKTTARLAARGVRTLKCSRQFPWGRSVSVNNIRLERIEGHRLLIIEMQSGDTIEAEVEEVSLQ